MENEKLEYPLNCEKEQKIKDLKNKIAELLDTENKNFSNKRCELTSKLKTNYTDAEDYLLYHILIGSTPAEENPPQKYDFSEENSIEEFIEKLHQELVEK